MEHVRTFVKYARFSFVNDIAVVIPRHRRSVTSQVLVIAPTHIDGHGTSTRRTQNRIHSQASSKGLIVQR